MKREGEKRTVPKYEQYGIWDRYLRLSGAKKRMLGLILCGFGFVGLNYYERIAHVFDHKEGAVVVASFMDKEGDDQHTLQNVTSDVPTAPTTILLDPPNSNYHTETASETKKDVGAPRYL